MAIASLIVALIGALIVVWATVQQFRMSPDDPKYNVGTGIAVTPPQKPFGAPAGMKVMHVSVPGARRLVVDQARLTKFTAMGSALQVVAVVLALLAR